MDHTQKRETLEEAVGRYVSETLSHIYTIKEFCSRKSKWSLLRETELDTMMDIKRRADNLNLKFSDVKNPERQISFGEFLVNALTPATVIDGRAQELEKELGAVLKETLEGLQKLSLFLESVDKLAVTSLFVFAEDNPMCHLPRGTSAAAVRSVISATRMASPLLIHFQRDSEAFFQPNLVNVDVLVFQLDKYIRISEELCEKIEKRSNSVPSCKTNDGKPDTCPLDSSLDLRSEDMQMMLEHLNQLNEIRMNQDIRMTFLFREAPLQFIGCFSKRSSRMWQFLDQLKESAAQLDRMKLGSRISSVAGSSVGLAGGVVSIVGLALAPVTAGASLTLTMVGVGLGVTSGVNSLTTGITEMAVNAHHGNKVNKIVETFMEDVDTILENMEYVASSTGEVLEQDSADVFVGVGRAVAKAGCIAKGIDAIVDCASAVKVVQNEAGVVRVAKLAAEEVKAARGLPNMASDLSEIGNVAKGTPLALSKSARAGFIALNSVFMGLDLFFICKDSISLAKGSKSETSKIIQGRVALWTTELDSWEKIHSSLCRGIWRFRKCQRILETPFYPRSESV